MQNSKNPRTDAEIDDLVNGLNHIAEDQLDRSCRATILDTIEFIKELKLERDQLRKELAESKSWVKASMESAAIASATIALLESERDTLRKMVDAFADCGDCGDEWLMADYRELPHVRARTAK